MAKIIDAKVAVPEKPYHFFGSTVLNWCLGESVEEVLGKLAKAAGAEPIKLHNKANGGLYAWVGKVESPRSIDYAIRNFAPFGVTVSESWDFNIKNSKGHCLPITREPKAEVADV